MKKLILIMLVVLNLGITLAFSPFAHSAPLSLATTSPVSPVQPPSDSHDEDSAHKSEAVSSDAVWQPLSTDQHAMRIITHQNGVGWWDAKGQLHIAPEINGIVEIPLQAVMISIPGDAAGVPTPPGWRKMMRPENGEWVIVRIVN